MEGHDRSERRKKRVKERKKQRDEAIGVISERPAVQLQESQVSRMRLKLAPL
jgi:hypothetical protein